MAARLGLETALTGFQYASATAMFQHAEVQGGQSLSNAPQTYTLEVLLFMDSIERLSSQQTALPIGELTTLGGVSADEFFHLEA